MKITVCVGTYCHLMGSMTLYNFLEDYLKRHPDAFELEMSNCLDVCNRESCEAPILKMDEKIYSKMSVEKLKTILKEL
ncbi:hypothetical protein Calab_2679 [Caldithrix abyssi DSM 13497]|uniref:Thioredoxin-like [2Fe-2S] ferredoxin n=2 Tax=Caldithrix abyssi DSM 13497 TaxID=880073 RepID=H1XQ37_CALAY|nr:hypothetical protein Calab_2679 [Caldithrix abyssi DSM 13497]